MVGVRLGGRADVARHRARHVRGAEANARGAAGLREDAQLEDDAAVVVAGAAVRADGLLDAVARERALGARQRRHRGGGAPEQCASTDRAREGNETDETGRSA